MKGNNQLFIEIGYSSRCHMLELLHWKHLKTTTFHTSSDLFKARFVTPDATQVVNPLDPFGSSGN